MTLPELAVKTSGYGGRGYVNPCQPTLPVLDFTGAPVLDAKGKPKTKRWVLPSVTTVLKAGAAPGITQWAVDQTAAYAVANVDSLLTRSETQGFNMLRWYHSRSPLPLEEGCDLRNYHTGVLNDAAELGTAMHEWIEADLDPMQVYPDVSHQPEAFWEMIPVWNDFQASHKMETVYTEVSVFNMEEGYAGTFDWMGYIDGKLTLLDIKTSRSVWPDHKRQLAALLNAKTMLIKVPGGDNWTEVPMPDLIEQVGLLHIRPDDVANNGDPVPAYCEYVEVEDLDLHYQAFLGLLNTKKADIAIAEREKERATSLRT